jgi:lipopolysaccharide biosynthesis glycosyltransferase
MKNREFHDIAIACDNSFVNHAITMLYSLYKNNSELKFNIHVLDADLNLKHKLKLITFFFRVGFKFQFYKVDYSLIKNAPISNHINLSTYNRIFLPSLLSKNINEVVYIDCDVIIIKNIDPILNCDITNYYVAAAEEIISDDDKRRLDFGNQESYFNAGILKVNLKKWREDEMQDKFIDFISSSLDKIKYWDQDVLNFCLKGNWKRLNQIYNVTHFFFYPNNYPPSYFDLNEHEYQEILENAAIIHYTSHQKPWIEGCKHPKKELYFQYQLTFKQLLFDKLIISTKN